VVAETQLSQVDGAQGRLVVRGFDVEALAASRGFEAVAALLLEGALGDAQGLAAMKRELGRARVRAHEELAARADLGATSAPDEAMVALRAGIATLSAEGSDRQVQLRMLAAVAVQAAAWHRARQGLALVTPDPERGHAEDLLRLLRGEAPSQAEAAALDAYLVTVAEHGMNASTFTARVVASTDSDAVSAVVAAIGTLKGPLHGGAPGPVLDMLDAIGRPEHAEKWLREELAAGRRIMGLGHRVYRVRDPRAAVLEGAVARLEDEGHVSPYLELARAVERFAVGVLAERYPERHLETNVEFYTAVLLDVLRIPRGLFTAVFAAARTAGWLAHIDEQRAAHRLIRPRQRYVGPMPESHATAGATGSA
jgi:citrate synthase